MKIFDLITAEALATYYNKITSDEIQMLGEGLFPNKKKSGLDLAWIKGNKGLAVALKPSAFDTLATVRDRVGVSMVETEMPFFRESMDIKERDRQDLLKFGESSNATIWQPMIDKIYDDRAELIAGAKIQGERMRMQLLSTGKIEIAANNENYSYDYDVDGTWAANNKISLSGTSVWSDTENSKPLEDIRELQEKIQAESGTMPTRAIMTSKTFNYLVQNKAIKMALNPLANGQNMVTRNAVRELFIAELNLSIAIYDKKFKNEKKETMNYFPDDVVTLIPATSVGNTYYGTTPEEADLLASNFNGDCSIVDGGIAVTTVTSEHPVNKKTIVSEIVLPTFERMAEVGVINVA